MEKKKTKNVVTNTQQGMGKIQARNRTGYDMMRDTHHEMTEEFLKSPQFSSVCLRARFDYISRLFGDSDDRCGRVPADLVWEHGCINDAEALDAEHAEMRVNDARFGRSADTCSGRLQKISRKFVRGFKWGEGGGRKGIKTAGTYGVKRGAAVTADEFLDLLVRNL